MTPELASRSACRWLYPVTYGGGLVEGDRIEYSVTVGPRCGALITTHSTTKVSVVYALISKYVLFVPEYMIIYTVEISH